MYGLLLKCSRFTKKTKRGTVEGDENRGGTTGGWVDPHLSLSWGSQGSPPPDRGRHPATHWGPVGPHTSRTPSGIGPSLPGLAPGSDPLAKSLGSVSGGWSVPLVSTTRDGGLGDRKEVKLYNGIGVVGLCGSTLRLPDPRGSHRSSTHSGRRRWVGRKERRGDPRGPRRGRWTGTKGSRTTDKHFWVVSTRHCE